MIRPILKTIAAAFCFLLLLPVPRSAFAGEASAANATPAPLKKLSISEVSALIGGQEKLHLFDSNPVERYNAGHLPGAVWLRYDAVEVGNLPPDKEARLVFYCANELCTASHTAARSALGFGYTNVFIMPAGITGWEKAGMPVEKARRRSS
jgi:rhodanese-related sulfurtransferase